MHRIVTLFNRFRLVWLAAAMAVGWYVASVAVAIDTPPAPTDKKADKLPDKKTDKPAEAKPDDIYAVPDGTPKEITDFLEKLQKTRPRFASRQEAVQHAVKVQWAIIEGADKILAQKTEDDVALSAAELKLDALELLAMNGIEGAMPAALKAATALKQDPRKEIAEYAAEKFASLRIASAPLLKPDERTALIRETLGDFKQQRSGKSIQTAMELGQALESMPDTKVPAEFYEQLAALMKEVGKIRRGTSEINLEPYADQLLSKVRRLQLPGTLMEVKGTTVDGQPFDWSKYRGKIVLVDFWATWCGPCIAELPNVKANYEKYHDRGFEVVGVSLDDDRDKLAGFIKDREIPWVNLFEGPKDGEPQQQPTAEMYAVTSIPTAILLDREGKAISLAARGEALTELLEQLLGKDDPATKK